jgi:hypothetical protein
LLIEFCKAASSIAGSAGDCCAPCSPLTYVERIRTETSPLPQGGSFLIGTGSMDAPQTSRPKLDVIDGEAVDAHADGRAVASALAPGLPAMAPDGAAVVSASHDNNHDDCVT